MFPILVPLGGHTVSGKGIHSVEDLEVYKRSFDLAMRVHDLSLGFPKFELYELGSQMRRSSNSVAANLAEGWGNRHLRVYLECVTRALGELRETRHHLRMAERKDYSEGRTIPAMLEDYEECRLMLLGLQRSLIRRLHG